jgi:UDP-N-acetyl-D-mannosaminuronate dehydrogenase
MKKSRFSANNLSGYCGKLNSQRKALHGSKVLVLGLACKPNVDDEPAWCAS